MERSLFVGMRMGSLAGLTGGALWYAVKKLRTPFSQRSAIAVFPEVSWVLSFTMPLFIVWSMFDELRQAKKLYGPPVPFGEEIVPGSETQRKVDHMVMEVYRYRRSSECLDLNRQCWRWGLSAGTIALVIPREMPFTHRFFGGWGIGVALGSLFVSTGLHEILTLRQPH